MAGNSSQPQMTTQNGPSAGAVGGGADLDDDTFERDLKEMLKDGPSLHDLSNTVQGGSGSSSGAQPMGGAAPTAPHAGATAAAAASVAASRPPVPSSLPTGTAPMPRSQTVPPGKLFQEFCDLSVWFTSLYEQ